MRNYTSHSWFHAKHDVNAWVPTLEEMQEDRTLVNTLALVDFSSCHNPASRNYQFTLQETLSVAYAKFSIFKDEAHSGNITIHSLENIDYSIAFLTTNILKQKTSLACSLHKPTLTLLSEMEDFLKKHVVSNLDNDNQSYCRDLITKMGKLLEDHSSTLTFSR